MISRNIYTRCGGYFFMKFRRRIDWLENNYCFLFQMNVFRWQHVWMYKGSIFRNAVKFPQMIVFFLVRSIYLYTALAFQQLISNILIVNITV